MEARSIIHSGHEEAKHEIEHHGQVYEGQYIHRDKAKFYSVVPGSTLIPHVRVEIQVPASKLSDLISAVKSIEGNNIQT